MRFKLLYTIIFLLSFIQNSNSENNLANVDNIFHIGKMDSHNKNFVLFFKTREKAILAKGEEFNYITDYPQDLYIYDKKTKIFELICKRVKPMISSRSIEADSILEALLNNSNLDWKVVGRGIDIVAQVNNIFGSLKLATNKRKDLILNFCKHEDCPEKIKSYLYENTEDDDFLPQTAKDIFMF